MRAGIDESVVACEAKVGIDAVRADRLFALSMQIGPIAALSIAGADDNRIGFGGESGFLVGQGDGVDTGLSETGMD